MAYQGKFRPKNTKKYLGDSNNIVYRSRWELKFMMYLDSHPNVVQWGSEELVIPYRSPIDNRVHRYFPDFIVKTKKGTMIIEVKPEAQTQPPKQRKRVTKQYIQEVATYGINQAKWQAATEYCLDRGWTFKIITESHLGLT